MATITEDYCSYEVAKLLCEKGFEIDTGKDYWKIGEDGTMYFMSSIGAYTSDPNIVYAIYRPENSYPCPTIQMAMKWLREVHNIAIDTEWEHLWYAYVKPMTSNPTEDDYYQCFSAKYEEAVEAALKYSLENLI